MKRAWTVFVLVLALSVGVSGLTFGQTLTLWDWHQPRMDLKLEYIEQYEKENPGIKFETQIIGWEDYWTKLMAGLAGGNVPDIASFHNSQTMTFLNHLQPYPDDLFPVEVMKEEIINFEAGYLFDGSFYFYPVGIMSGLIFYNKDLWAEAGYTEADIPETWDEFAVLAKELTQYEDNGSVKVAGFAPNGILGVFWVDLNYQKGGTLYSDGGTTTNWNTEAGIEALQYIEKLIFEERVTEPGFLTFTEAMGTGSAAMVYSWSWLNGWLDTNYPDINYGTFRLPTFDGKLAPGPVARNNHETGMAVMKAAPEVNKETAFKFLKWLYEETDYLVRANLILGTAPANRNLLDDPRIKSNPTINTIAEQVPYTILPGELPGEIETTGGLLTIQDLIFNGVSAEEALEIANEEAASILQERPIKWYVEDLYTPVTE